jgi:hypothetical protein
LEGNSQMDHIHIFGQRAIVLVLLGWMKNRFVDMLDAICIKIKLWSKVNYGNNKLTLLELPSSHPF